MQFDMKQADIFLVDGFTMTGVTVTGVNAIGVSNIPISGAVGIIPTGATIQFGADTTVYSVTAHTETLGNTTQITVTPALVVATTAAEATVIGGRRLKIKVGDGTLSYDEKRIVEYKKDRGKLSTVRLGDQEPMSCKLDLRWEFLRSDAADPVTFQIPQPEEIFKNTGAAATWTSSSADPCEPFAINIYVIYTPLCPGVKKETILLHDFRWEDMSHDFKQGMLNISGKCNVEQAVVTRV